MNQPLFERDPSETRNSGRDGVNPLLKLALELGPLLVFFFANARGEEEDQKWPEFQRQLEQRIDTLPAGIPAFGRITLE